MSTFTSRFFHVAGAEHLSDALRAFVRVFPDERHSLLGHDLELRGDLLRFGLGPFAKCVFEKCRQILLQIFALGRLDDAGQSRDQFVGEALQIFSRADFDAVHLFANSYFGVARWSCACPARSVASAWMRRSSSSFFIAVRAHACVRALFARAMRRSNLRRARCPKECGRVLPREIASNVRRARPRHFIGFPASAVSALIGNTTGFGIKRDS